MTPRQPARPSHHPAVPTPTPGHPDVEPVEVRIIGSDKAVHALVTALKNAAQCGPASYRPTRYGDGTRAYLSIVVPTEDA